MILVSFRPEGGQPACKLIQLLVSLSSNQFIPYRLLVALVDWLWFGSSML